MGTGLIPAGQISFELTFLRFSCVEEQNDFLLLFLAFLVGLKE